MAARTTIAEPAEKWTGALEASRDRLLAAARGGGHGVAVLAHASAGRIVAGGRPAPPPPDPPRTPNKTPPRGGAPLLPCSLHPPTPQAGRPTPNNPFLAPPHPP